MKDRRRVSGAERLPQGPHLMDGLARTVLQIRITLPPILPAAPAPPTQLPTVLSKQALESANAAHLGCR